jgi:hypothetical protein
MDALKGFSLSGLKRASWFWPGIFRHRPISITDLVEFFSE